MNVSRETFLLFLFLTISIFQFTKIFLGTAGENSSVGTFSFAQSIIFSQIILISESERLLKASTHFPVMPLKRHKHSMKRMPALSILYTLPVIPPSATQTSMKNTALCVLLCEALDFLSGRTLAA